MAPLPTSKREFELLAQVRAVFLNAHGQTGGTQDYWQSEEVVALYDATFARRIFWKWEAVLEELSLSLGWSWPANMPTPCLVDWGCGSGAASEAFVGRFGLPEGGRLELLDRSRCALNFSAKKLTALLQQQTAQKAGALAPPATPQVNTTWVSATAQTPQPGGNSPRVMLLSHVLTELDEPTFDTLVNDIKTQAGMVLWVEPGTPFCSARLVQVRERLKDVFRILAPCPHQGPCGLAVHSGATLPNSAWCHHFAAPPAAIFQDSAWVKTARELGIDLRSLPVSYLVLVRPEFAPPALQPSTKSTHPKEGETELAWAAAAAAAKAPPDSPRSGGGRVIGEPRTYKGHSKLLVCHAQAVQEVSVLHRREKALLKALERAAFERTLTPEELERLL